MIFVQPYWWDTWSFSYIFGNSVPVAAIWRCYSSIMPCGSVSVRLYLFMIMPDFATEFYMVGMTLKKNGNEKPECERVRNLGNKVSSVCVLHSSSTEEFTGVDASSFQTALQVKKQTSVDRGHLLISDRLKRLSLLLPFREEGTQNNKCSCLEKHVMHFNLLLLHILSLFPLLIHCFAFVPNNSSSVFICFHFASHLKPCVCVSQIFLLRWHFTAQKKQSVFGLSFEL